MSIQDAQMVIYKPLSVTDDPATNGGKLSSNAILSGVANNVFPNVYKAERIAGSIKHRKVFCKADSNEGLDLLNPQIWLDIITPGQDYVIFSPATLDDIEQDNDGVTPPYDEWFGCGSLRTPVGQGATQLVVNVEDAALASGPMAIFRAGDSIRITNKPTINDSGVEEEFTILSVTPDVSTPGDEFVTIDLDGAALANDYLVPAEVRVMSIYEPNTLTTSSDAIDETGLTGSYANLNVNLQADIVFDNRSTVDDVFKIAFDNASTTDFNVYDGQDNLIGTGTVSTGCAPINTDWGTLPYFTLTAATFAGSTFNVNDYFTFRTRPAAVAIWQKRVVPPNCTSLSGNKTTLVFSGESA